MQLIFVIFNIFFDINALFYLCIFRIFDEIIDIFVFIILIICLELTHVFFSLFFKW
jgi:hypothetical protein